MADERKLTAIFVPRSVARRQRKDIHDKKTTTKSKHRGKSLTPVASSVSNGQDDIDEVKKLSKDQRWPSSDEPVCVVCAKFGEYICDETDEDICSLQCKTVHLKSWNTKIIISEPRNNKFSMPSIARNSTDELNEPFDTYFTRCTRYKLYKTIDTMSKDKMEFYREKLEIKVKGKNVPKLILDFKHCSFSDKLVYNLKEHGYVAPTPVQMQVIPIGMCGHDALVAAATSTGKTASFLLPVIQAIHNCLGSLPPSHDFCKDVLAIVLAPTHELCMQIEDQCKQFSKSLENIKTALLIGGVPLPQQLYRLKHKIQLVMGTPGRINDILQNHEGTLRLHRVKIVILDEVDVMLQMGFQNQIQSIISEIPPKPQFLMFSATIPPSIENMAQKIMSEPTFVSVGESGLPNKSIKQLVLWVEDVSKRKKLFSIINDGKHFIPPVLIFVESKIGADMLCDAISAKLALKCEAIHSDKTQQERTSILENFLNDTYDILVSTNVMGRGIDLINVRQVILFDMPNTMEEYVHQVGRAGRLESTGYSITFVNNSNKKLFLDMKELFQLTEDKLPEELLNSPHLAFMQKKGKKNRTQRKEKRKVWSNDIVNPQNLLDILTKKKRK